MADDGQPESPPVGERQGRACVNDRGSHRSRLSCDGSFGCRAIPAGQALAMHNRSEAGTGCARPAPTPHFIARCTDRNRGISVQVDMRRGEGALYMNGNHVFRLTARYLPIRGAPPDNLIELKGSGARAFHLNRSRKILFFREGSRGEFCRLEIERR